MTVTDLPIEFQKGCLTRSELDPDPIVQFNAWYAQACEASVPYAHAMSLATVSKEGMPSIRTVLLKSADAHGFVFFTNYRSRKGRDIEQQSKVALLFLWKPLERQVTITGHATKIAAADSAAYFADRPRGSQLGAIASPQSQVVASRDYLEERFRAADRTYADRLIQRPEHWGGYCVKPRTIEFWQGRPSRLHDRFMYCLNSAQSWTIERLAP